MAKSAPGKHYRKGLSVMEVMRMFPDDATAEAWFAEQRWGSNPHCPHCGSLKIVDKQKHKSMPYRCKDCRKRFSVKTGTIMQSSKLGYQAWAITIYLMTTGLKGVASMKLHRDLQITQKAAWHLAHRVREAWNESQKKFGGPTEVDETYMGGLRKNMPKYKREKLTGRGGKGKVAIVGAKDRTTNQIRALPVPNTKAKTLQKFVAETTEEGSMVFTDEAYAYEGLKNREHEAVCHSVGEYVRDMAHTNGMESFWATIKRAHNGTFHKISPKHLERYVTEFAGKHNKRDEDTLNQMCLMASAMTGKQLRYKDLIADNGLSNGAREN